VTLTRFGRPTEGIVEEAPCLFANYCLCFRCRFFVPRIGSAGSLSAEDLAKIKPVHAKYEEAWLKGDADGVRALFTEDCVLLPPHGDTPRIGKKGLNDYWFPPDAPPTTITKLVVTPTSIGGDGEIAYVWVHR